MVKRLFDIAFSAVVLVVSSPLLLLAAIGIKLSSPGPVIYRARRVGKGGGEFVMFKLRSMHVTSGAASVITAPGDARVFAVGNLVRRLKIDELPQFWNILRGDLSLVGPRAEAPDIVDEHYNSWMRETLDAVPGVTSPGAIYNYIMLDCLLDPRDPEATYVARMLPPKLALERAYVERASFLRDLQYVALTALAIAANALGRKVRLPAADVECAKRWAPQGPYPE